MKEINQKRIYSFLTDITISNTIGIFILSIFDIERTTKVSSFTIFGHYFNYGYSFQLLSIIFYFIIFDLSNNGKTFGKLIFSIYVVSEINHKKLSLGMLLERTFYKTLSIAILPFAAFLFLKNDGYTIQDKQVKTTTIF